MNKNVILIILIVFLLIPVSGNKIKTIFDINTAEGAAGIVVNLNKFTDIEVTVCPCNGNKFVMSGDGIAKIPCQCGTGCTCKKMDQGSLPVGEVGQPTYYTYVFGAKWCQPCVYFDTNDVPRLTKDGWKFVHGKWVAGANVVIADVDTDSYLFNKYAEGEHQPIPFYVVTRNGKKVKAESGYKNWKQFSKFHNDAVQADKESNGKVN